MIGAYVLMITAFTVAALARARRDGARVLWGRLALIIVAGYLAGVYLGAWPADAAAPGLRWLLGFLGAWESGS